MSVFRGSVGIRWGLNNAGSTAFGTSALMQSYDVERKLDEAEIRDGQGEIRAWYGYNTVREASFVYFVGAASAGSGSAVVMPAVGDLITVTQTGATPSQATSSYWICKSATENATNTDAVKVTVRATEYQYITS